MKIDREKYNQIIDEVYENYEKITNNFQLENPIDDFIIKTLRGEMVKIETEDGDDYRILTQEEFINKIKTDDEFAKKWGLKIEKKEYTLVNGEFIKEINVYHIPKTSTEYIETKFIVLPTGDIENE